MCYSSIIVQYTKLYANIQNNILNMQEKLFFLDFNF